MSVKPSEVPWTTAPEYAVDGLEELGIEPESEFWNAAIRRARRHGVEETHETYDGGSHSPRSIAAGAIYMTGLLANQKVTQAQLEEALDVSHKAITDTYHPMLEAEGYSKPSSSTSEEDGLGWIGRLKHAAEVVSR